jgi:hypothetical protein
MAIDLGPTPWPLDPRAPVPFHSHWSVDRSESFDPPWILRYDPTPDPRRQPDGSKSFSLIFPALQVTHFVADPEKVCRQVAAILNSDFRMEG